MPFLLQPASSAHILICLGSNLISVVFPLFFIFSLMILFVLVRLPPSTHIYCRWFHPVQLQLIRQLFIPTAPVHITWWSVNAFHLKLLLSLWIKHETCIASKILFRHLLTALIFQMIIVPSFSKTHTRMFPFLLIFFLLFLSFTTSLGGRILPL